MTEPDWDALRAGCDRALNLHGPTRVADLLGTIPPDTAVDRYGDGGVVAEVEAGVAGVLGCCLAGPEDVVAEVREWRQRMGGTLFGLWPGAASALTCLRRRLPLMPANLERAREVAAAVRDLPGVRVVPDPPHTPMLHLLLETTPEACTAAAVRLAEEGLWTWQRTMPTDDPAVLKAELSVGDATMALPLDEIRREIAVLAGS